MKGRPRVAAQSRRAGLARLGEALPERAPPSISTAILYGCGGNSNGGNSTFLAFFIQAGSPYTPALL